MKGIIIAVLALAILGGGGYFAYTKFMPQEEVEQAAVEEKKEKDAVELAYVDMEPFVFSVVGSDRAHNVLSMAVALEISELKHAEKIEALKPRLTNAFLMEMYTIVERKSVREGGALPVAEIRERLTRIGKKVAGDDVVDDVLLQILNRHPA